MKPLHCLWAKSSNRTRAQFECDVTWFCFYFDFVHSLDDAVVIPYFVGEGGGGDGFRLSFNVRGQGVEKIYVDGQGVFSLIFF